MVLRKLLYAVLLLMSFTGSVKAQSNTPVHDFGIKGFYLDLRNEVMTMDALKQFAKEISALGMNTLMVEWEATFPYDKHATISNEAAYSRPQIQSFIKYCQTLGIDVIPVQECFGHVQYILRHDRYSALREDNRDLSQVCPLKTTGDSLLFADLFADMASLHPSKYMHIGGDETTLLGHDDTCRQMVAEEGASKLFVNYMKMMCDIALKLGKTPVMWADMLLKHPEAADLLPKETILLDWNYGWKINHFGNVRDLQKKGFEFWGAPSIRSHPDNWFVTDWMTHFNNQKDFIPYGRKAGYKAMFMTSWSTSGVYSFTWDIGNEVLDMEPIRNNYPLSGFRILIACYAQSLQQEKPIDPEAFVVQYAQTRFGVSQPDGLQLWKTFNLTPELIVRGKPAKSKDIATMAAANNQVRKTLAAIHPTRNEKEFEHFRLMADLRNYYLQYKQVQAVYNAKGFNIAAALHLITALEALLQQSKELDSRFDALNKGFLKDGELKKQSIVRNKPVKQLYERLINLDNDRKN